MNSNMISKPEWKPTNFFFFFAFFIMSCAIASFNVNGLRQILKRKNIFHYLKQKQYDIILLQETHSTSADEKQLICEWGEHILFAQGESRKNGVAILFDKNLKVFFGSKCLDSSSRIFLTEIQIERKFTLASLYAPTKDDPKFFDDLFLHFQIFLHMT